jgi:hypothetical protein
MVSMINEAGGDRVILAAAQDFRKNPGYFRVDPKQNPG